MRPSRPARAVFIFGLVLAAASARSAFAQQQPLKLPAQVTTPDPFEESRNFVAASGGLIAVRIS